VAAMWIKICGITSLEDAKTAVDAEADAVGFVFAASSRRVTPETVREITRALPSSVEKIGVFVDASADDIADTCGTAGLTGVQLHGAYSSRDVSHVRMRMKETSHPLRVVRVVHYEGDAVSFARRMQSLTERTMTEADESAVLVDTGIAGKLGGTGVPFDWTAAQDVFIRHAGSVRLIAAGGLHPGNVRQAIQTMRPWGVDVSSGVESVPGRKDRQRIREFIRAARAAAVEFAEATPQ
jgi:phosphoribosylanthranilate isomerase